MHNPLLVVEMYRRCHHGRQCWAGEAFLSYLQTGTEPYPIEEEVELIAALEAGKRSLKEGREVTLTKVPG